MKNKSKTNWKIDENTIEKFNRYGIRKYNVGAASVAILSGLFFLGGADAQAAETGSSQTAAQAVATESGSNATANAWEKAITTVVEKEKSTNVAATGTENKPVETVASKETVATAPKAETREATTTPRRARRARSVGNNPDEVTPSSQPATTGSTGSQPATTGSTGSQPSTTGSTASQPKPSGEYAGTEIKAYYDNNNNGVFDEGDELISSTVIPPAPKGENGNDGKDAIRGAELLSGIIAPRPEDGKDGDTYIDATTGDVYKKRDGAWGKIGNIRGPQGEQGQKGDKGENGKDGRAPKIKVEDIAKSAESAGVSSRSGIRITVYDDKNNNDVFDEGDTILNTKDVYNGTDGKNGVDGQTPKVKAERDEANKQTTLTFYIDKDGDGNYTAGKERVSSNNSS